MILWCSLNTESNQKYFANEKILEQYYVKIYEINPYFYKNYKEKIKADKNGHEYIKWKYNLSYI